MSSKSEKARTSKKKLSGYSVFQKMNHMSLRGAHAILLTMQCNFVPDIVGNSKFYKHCKNII